MPLTLYRSALFFFIFALAVSPAASVLADIDSNKLISGLQKLAADSKAATQGAVTVGADDRTMAIDLDSGALVRLNQPAAAVFVANPEIADVQIKTPTLIYVFGKAAGETTLFAVDSTENILLSRKVVVNYSLGRLRDAIKTMTPSARVEVTSMDGGVVLRGQVHTATEAENIRSLAAKFIGSSDAVMNNLEIVGSNQVNLRIRIAEVSRDTLKNIGFNWEWLMNPNRLASRFVLGLASGGRNPGGTTAGNAFSTRFVDPDTFITNYSLSAGFDGSNYDLNGVVDLLHYEGLINVLAEPNLTAVSGETANFLVGGEFPIPIALDNGSLTIEFKPYGIGLGFTPTIIGPNRISMRIRPEVSQLSNQGAVRLNNITIPAITTRRAETTVEMGSGQSFVLAGLINNNGQQDISQYPFLGDIPVLGALFKSDRFRRRESELVIIATPYLVQPSNTAMAIPHDGMRNPTDLERLSTGAQIGIMESAKGKNAVPSAGFVTE